MIFLPQLFIAKIINYRILTFAFIILIHFQVCAQKNEIGASFGVMNYQGELAKYINWKSPGLGGGIFFRHNIDRALSVKLGLNVGNIQVDDAQSNEPFAKARNHKFATFIAEASTQLEYNFLNYRNDRNKQNWSPYLFGGIGGFKMDPYFNIQPNYPLYSVAIPFGVGIKYVLYGQWNLGLEFGARKTFTDYLDDVQIDKNLSQTSPNDPRYYTGNPHDKDMYFFTNISVSYTFYKLRCPSFYKYF